jgi:hypothetical protein
MPSTLTYCAGATIESSQLASAIMVSPHSSTMPGAVYPNIASELGCYRRRSLKQPHLTDSQWVCMSFLIPVQRTGDYCTNGCQPGYGLDPTSVACVVSERVGLCCRTLG